MRDDDPVSYSDFVRGDATGLAIPAHGEALRAAGETFLTDAFRSFGALSADDRVVRISRLEPFPGGNWVTSSSCRSNMRTRNRPAHRAFVKFSRDFTDAFRDRRRHELQAEVGLAALPRRPTSRSVFRPYFADFHRESGTGILISQRIAFGSGGIEPLRPKCMDHELAEPLGLYRATVTALAADRRAQGGAAIPAGREALFPFRP